MKKWIFILIFINQSILLNAQLKFTTDSNNKIFENAKEQNKLVAFVIENENCKNCNELAEKGLSVDSVKAIIENNFIIKKVSKLSELAIIDTQLYNLSKYFFGLICTNENGNILSIHQGSTSNSNHYFKTLHNALQENLNYNNSLTTLINTYYSNNKSFFDVQNLINKILFIHIEPSQKIIDELVQIAPDDSAKSITFIQYILKLAPLVDSKAKNYVAQNQEVFSTSWYRMDLKERIEINNKVIIKSLSKAIQDKNKTYANAVANFRASTYSYKNYQDYQRAYDIVMLSFYKGIKDTQSLINLSIRFYEVNVMKFSVDSILRIDSLNNTNTINSNSSNFNKNQFLSIDTTSKNTIKTTSTSSSLASFYANILNEGAWSMYTFTKDIFKIRKALDWAKRAIEFDRNYAVIDSYARLLYRTNNIEEAILMEKEAIALAKKEKISTVEFEEVLKKMRKKLTAIDEY